MRWKMGLGLLAVLAVLVAPAAAQSVGVESVHIKAGAYTVARSAEGDVISLSGFGRQGVPGVPELPAHIFAIAIPPGAEFAGLTVETGPGVTLSGQYNIPPERLPRVIGDENPVVAGREQAAFDQNYASAYQRDDVFPAQVAEFVRTAGYREYNLVDVRVTPFAYRPLSGQLTVYPDITVNVQYTLPKDARSVAVGTSPRVARVARDTIVNYDEAQKWYTVRSDSRGLYDYVVITLDALTDDVQPLVNWEIAKGRTVQVVTTTWINANYTGYDLAEKMRNFLREKYPAAQWGIEDVLLVGSYDDVPMRRIAQDVGYGQPETDFYYAELSNPDSSSWDSNGNHLWGEDADAVDFYNEINVGRIPWSNAATVASICNKSVAFEQNSDPAYKKNMLLLGGFFWEDTDNAELMEAKINQPWLSDWTFTRLYEQNSTVYSTFACDMELTHANVMSVWPSGTYAFVNWAGHGSPTSAHIMGYNTAAFIQSSDCALLNDNYPAIIFADACSNSDTDSTNIGQSMLQRGAVGFVGATKVAYGSGGWNSAYDGSSQSMDYFFTARVTSGEYTQGAAHQWALREMYTNGLWYYTKYEMCEWGALWGNPDLAMGVPAPLTITFPAGVPDALTPGAPTAISVQIADGAESYVSGSGALYYRYDGGAWQSVALTHDTGVLYIATLPPAACGDTPEFYFSAASDGGSTIYAPAAAPASVYSAIVGALTPVLDDNFEANLGWTTDIGTATSGQWDRGVPVNDASWQYDPTSDADGSGQCWLTQNELGNTDVDNGYVDLFSPVLDLSAGDATISYDYYLWLTVVDGIDRLQVDISGNGSAGPWIEIARHDTDGGLTWRHHEITPADLTAAGVTTTSTTMLRFRANDDGTQSIVEAGLDAVRIDTFSCAPAYAKGDTNCDGAIDFGDINAFVAALTDPSGYAAKYPNCDRNLADVDINGEVGFSDINPFVALLIH